MVAAAAEAEAVEPSMALLYLPTYGMSLCASSALQPQTLSHPPSSGTRPPCDVTHASTYLRRLASSEGSRGHAATWKNDEEKTTVDGSNRTTPCRRSNACRLSAHLACVIVSTELPVTAGRDFLFLPETRHDQTFGRRLSLWPCSLAPVLLAGDLVLEPNATPVHNSDAWHPAGCRISPCPLPGGERAGHMHHHWREYRCRNSSRPI